MRRLCVAASILSVSALCTPALAIYPYVSFDELVQKADAIFQGKVLFLQSRFGPNDKTILTDVTFQLEKLLYAKAPASARIQDHITLTFAGGRIGDQRMMVTGVPSPELDETYVIFTRLDGKTYASPTIGGAQGLFHVLKDETNGKHYPLTYGNSPIIGIKGGHLLLGRPVVKIQGGEGKAATIGHHLKTESPQSKSGAKAELSPEASELTTGRIEPMDMDLFVAEIQKRIHTGVHKKRGDTREPTRKGGNR